MKALDIITSIILLSTVLLSFIGSALMILITIRDFYIGQGNLMSSITAVLLLVLGAGLHYYYSYLMSLKEDYERQNGR